MEGIKKAQIYGAIAVIFFVLLFVIPNIMINYANSMGYRPEDWDTMEMIVNLTSIFILIFIICTIIFTILAIYTYLKYKTIKKEKASPKNNAVKILYERYAKGEITKEELEKMKKDIES